jgi:glutathione S-transferase
MAMFEALASCREWLAGRRISLADLIAAGHLSVLDFFGEISWASYPSLKTWYSKLKSRPCFRTLLSDRFPGVHPATWYADLDV